MGGGPTSKQEPNAEFPLKLFLIQDTLINVWFVSKYMFYIIYSRYIIYLRRTQSFLRAREIFGLDFEHSFVCLVTIKVCFQGARMEGRET